MNTLPKLHYFNENVLTKYKIYNSIFMTLPFDTINDTGTLLPLFQKICKAGFAKGKNPAEIVAYFTNKYLDNPTERERIDLLFRFIQYIERQVVLFDAIEDASFPIIHNMEGVGTLSNSITQAVAEDKMILLKSYLKELKVHPVLTAHPTQFYPGNVLAIITDLAKAVKRNDFVFIEKLLAQLGKTPFFKHKKPTPYDEAISLIWYLENVFYHSISNIYNYISKQVFLGEKNENEIVSIGFWPGGDRDGNPFVTTEITLKVATRLRFTIIKNYYRDLRKIKRRLTFKGIEDVLTDLEAKLLYYSTNELDCNFTLDYFLTELTKIRIVLIEKHQSLFLEDLDDLINKIHLFGFHFATMDIRQDSRVHTKVFDNITKKLIKDRVLPTTYNEFNNTEKIALLSTIKGKLNPLEFEDKQTRKTLKSIYALQEIQTKNGEKAANRYIISNNQTSLDVMHVFAMLNLCGFDNALSVDVVPLFETVLDLENAANVMRELYNNSAYRLHLAKRKNKQTIMLGFSDGTKDGGYLMSNWGIYSAKIALTKVSSEFGVEVVFFDGRGGPPARGGGKSHQFYASLGTEIAAKEIQLTIQGQTISSNFGTLESSQYNLEQLISAGISNAIFNKAVNTISKTDKAVLEDLAKISYKAYVAFKEHKCFIPYLENRSTLKYYGQANIGSRPSKRAKSDKLIFADLRAIPFVGSWSQLKQNVPGFYGIGTALNTYKKQGEFYKVQELYKNAKFFRVLLENSMMSLTKSFFELTAYMADDKKYGEFWKLIYDEYELSKKLLLELAGYNELMQNDLSTKASIKARDEIVLPLLTIQQFALQKIKELTSNSINPNNNELCKIYEKMVTRSLFGNINASRNSA